jgi:hypothetical protein
MAKYINPYTDFGFKKLFGEEANKDLLIDFLNQLLPPHHQIADLSFKNVENLPDLPTERKAIFDIQDEYEQSRLSYLEVKEAVNTAEMDGMKKKALSIGKEMKQAGEPREKIKKYTGLTDSEIDRL